MEAKRGAERALGIVFEADIDKEYQDYFSC